MSAEDQARRYNLAPCGLVSTSMDGVILDVNATFETLTGFSRDDVVGKRSFVDLLSAGGRIYHDTHFAPLISMQGSAHEIAFEVVTAAAERLPVLVSAAVDTDVEPRVVHLAVFAATARREYEQELLRQTHRAEASEARATALARTLQQTLIPPSPPAVPGLDVAAVYRPAGNGEEVGGDFYDVFEVGDDDWVVVLGDISGKGVEAAVLTALVRYTLRAAAIRLPQPHEALAALNEVLLRQPTDRFCTVAVMRLHKEDGGWRATMSFGGHPPAILVTESGTSVTTIGEPGMLVGAFDTTGFTDSAVVLMPGDALVLYTDGVTEARSGVEFFGERRLASGVSEHLGSAASISEGLLADVMHFQGDIARDDIAVVAVSVPAR